MKKIFAALVFLIAFSHAGLCQLRSIKGHCGLYYKTLESLHKQQDSILQFYNFQSGQTIASIGAQCCNWEAAYAAVSDNLNFYLEDIDSAYFNEKQASFAWKYYDSLCGKPMTSNYRLVLGDEKKTNLPDRLFDKILIINSFHEFTFQKEMLADIKNKLKPGGILFIDETLARRSGELHGVCHKRIYLSEELIAILKETGFEYVDGLDMEFRKSKPVRKIFAFKKS